MRLFKKNYSYFIVLFSLFFVLETLPMDPFKDFSDLVGSYLRTNGLKKLGEQISTQEIEKHTPKALIWALNNGFSTKNLVDFSLKTAGQASTQMVQNNVAPVAQKAVETIVTNASSASEGFWMKFLDLFDQKMQSLVNQNQTIQQGVQNIKTDVGILSKVWGTGKDVVNTITSPDLKKVQPIVSQRDWSGTLHSCGTGFLKMGYKGIEGGIGLTYYGVKLVAAYVNWASASAVASFITLYVLYRCFIVPGKLLPAGLNSRFVTPDPNVKVTIIKKKKN